MIHQSVTEAILTEDGKAAANNPLASRPSAPGAGPIGSDEPAGPPDAGGARLGGNAALPPPVSGGPERARAVREI